MFSKAAILSITSYCEQGDIRKISRNVFNVYRAAWRNVGVLYNTQGGIVYG